MTNQAEFEARVARAEIVRKAAEALGVALHIKHAGRWCRLARIEGANLVYAAPAKEMRTRLARHRPVFIEVAIKDAQDAFAVEQILAETEGK